MMKEKIIFGLLLLGVVTINAQVRIGGTDEVTANTILDLNANDAANTGSKGIVLPRVALTSVNDASTVGPHRSGMTVYNTATTNGDINTVVQPGVYYNNGSRWIKVRNTTDPINSTDISATFDAWLTIKIQDLFASGGVVTNSCPDVVTGKTTTNSYKVGDFGVAGCWTTENLRDSAGLVHQDKLAASDYFTPSYRYPRTIPNDSTNNAFVHSHGLLYTWTAASGRTGVLDDEPYPTSPSLNQGICPSGWHLPSDAEYSFLELVISTAPANTYATEPAAPWDNTWFTSMGSRGTQGSKMRVTGGSGFSGTAAVPAQRGFGDPLAGYGLPNGVFNTGSHGYFWTASSQSTNNAYCRDNNASGPGLVRELSQKSVHFSVRCKKN